MSSKDIDSGVVYSTGEGRLCPKCATAKERCECAKANAPASGDGIVRLRYEKKGRKGKGVVVIQGIALAEPELKQIAKALKQKAGSGGSVKNGTIEIQGEHLELIKSELLKRGFTVKGAK